MTFPRLEDQEHSAYILAAIVDFSDDAIISLDLNGIITSWNPSAERLYGYTAAEAIGQPVSILIPLDRLDEEPQILGRIRRGERVDHLETVRKCKDGKAIDVSVTVSPIRNAQGVIMGASKISRDVTEARKAERGSRLLAAIVDSSDDAIVSKDLNGVVTSWNRSAERLFGYPASEMIGQPITKIIPSDRIEEEPRILARIRNGERVDHFETIRQRKDGTLIDISLTISPVRDANGKVVGASKIARDITERKRVDTAIRRVNHDLEQFAFSASHDLQEPLRNIKIYSELLTRRFGDKLEGEALEFLGYLRAGATRMEALVRDLLAYTRIGSVETPLEGVDANVVLAEVLESLGGAIAESGAVVTSDKMPRVPMHSLHLQQVFQNLIGNAIKYRGEERTPKVHVTGVRQGGCYTFSIRDNGIGIAPQYRETIFKLFKRLHSNQEYAGTGLGLAICQRIVEQYDGRIWVESEPGEGSTFHFTIRC
jgi:PAS domain S-box-containing protein